MEQVLKDVKTIMESLEYEEMYFSKKVLTKTTQRNCTNVPLMMKRAFRLFLDNDLQIIDVDSTKVLIRRLDFERGFNYEKRF